MRAGFFFPIPGCCDVQFLHWYKEPINHLRACHSSWSHAITSSAPVLCRAGVTRLLSSCFFQITIIMMMCQAFQIWRHSRDKVRRLSRAFVLRFSPRTKEVKDSFFFFGLICQITRSSTHSSRCTGATRCRVDRHARKKSEPPAHQCTPCSDCLYLRVCVGRWLIICVYTFAF